MSETFKPLIKLTKKQMSYVEDDFHHACLTSMNLVPSNDNRYSCLDYTFEEITHIIKLYGKKPCKDHWYWKELAEIKFYEDLNYDNCEPDSP
jgi:hypothetical protein